jgi:hypothetical protein
MTIDQTNYQELLIEVRERIRLAQYAALKAVNQELIVLYWDIGRLIVDRLYPKVKLNNFCIDAITSIASASPR